MVDPPIMRRAQNKTSFIKSLSSYTHYNFEVIASHQCRVNAGSVKTAKLLIAKNFKTFVINYEI